MKYKFKQSKEDMEEKYKAENTPLNVLTDKYVNGDICYDDFEKEVKALYSCKEEIKPTLKEFDLEAAKAGKPVCTRDGRKARIICFDCKDQHYPIVALIECDDTEVVQNYSNKGEAIIGNEWDKDLMMLPKKKEGWVNVYQSGSSFMTSKSIFNSKEGAIKFKEDVREEEYYLDTIKIIWKE